MKSLGQAVELDPDNYRAVEALEKAQDGRKRLSEMVKQEEITLKKQAQKKKDENANANGNSNGNAGPGPAPKPSP